MALGDYLKTIYVNSGPPGISAERLNNNENKTDELDKQLQTHAGDTTKHITAAERDSWNGKVNKAGDTIAGNLLTQLIFELDANDSRLAGTKKNDALCWNGKCVYGNTPTSGTVELTNCLANNLRFGSYTLVARMKSANNTIATGSVKIDIQKRLSGTYTSITNRTLKPTEFSSTSAYQNFYAEFEYGVDKAENNELKVIVTLLTQTSAYEVNLDSMIILPKVIGIFAPNS